MGAIAVYGSLNADLVIRMGRFPGPGETVRAESFEEFSGGKGANQAAAAGRLGGRVSMFGALGADGFAENLKRSLAESGVSTGDLLVVDDTPTGLAHIWVDGGGENAIAVLPEPTTVWMLNTTTRSFQRSATLLTFSYNSKSPWKPWPICSENCRSIPRG